MLFCTFKDVFCNVLQIYADWERASLRPSSQPSSVFKQSPQDETYITEEGFMNTNLVQDEESQESDDLIFALKTGKPLSLKMYLNPYRSLAILLIPVNFFDEY